MSRRPASSPSRAVIYARYSTDKQREESIADQVRQCKAYAARLGWTVVGEYADPAASGEGVKRPEYERMQADAENGKYDVVIADTVARLDRQPSRVHHWHERLKFLNIAMHTVSQGEIDTLKLSIFAGIAANYIETVRHETRRALLGKVMAGLSAGGLGYGYRADPAKRGGRLIDADEAAVVRRVFGLYADGVSPRTIAAMLNAERVPGPGGKPWGDTTIRGQVKRGTGLLNNMAYIGAIAWDRCSYVKDPRTGKRQARPKPPEEWEVVDAPELRIVDDEIWARVKTRQGEVRTEMHRDTSNPLNGGRRAQHLLSGLLTCGSCGSPYVMVDARRYGCNNHRSKGQCANSHKIARIDIEERVAEAMRHRLMAPEVVEGLLRTMAESQRDSASRADSERAGIETRLRRIDGQITKLVAAITDAGHSAALLGKLSGLETDKAKLESDIAALEDAAAPLPPLSTEKIVAAYRLLIEQHVFRFFDPAMASTDDPGAGSQLRDRLRGMIEGIVVTPLADDAGVAVTLRGDFRGILAALNTGEPIESKGPSVATEGPSSSVVAGAGFEPATFRL